MFGLYLSGRFRRAAFGVGCFFALFVSHTSIIAHFPKKHKGYKVEVVELGRKISDEESLILWFVYSIGLSRVSERLDE